MELGKIAVVISAHQRIESVETYLRSFLKIVEDDRDLIFIDNGSEGELSAWVGDEFPGITIIALEKNRFFCGGYNAGIRLAMDRGYDFILISNADAEVVNPGFLEVLLSSARKWPRGAFFGPLVFWQKIGNIQKTCLEFPKVSRNFLLWLPWRLAKEALDGQPQKETEVEFLNGVCVLCRVEALKEIGLMDENMGGYMEDADWAWRAREKGWSSIFVPVPSIIHHESENGYEPYSLKTFLLKRNTVYWYKKIGQTGSAWSYARASLALAVGRFLLAGSSGERQKHRYFLQRLTRAYRGLLQDEPLAEWFGPPLGPWEGG